MGNQMRPVSQSALNKFRDCPKQYWFGYCTDFQPIYYSQDAFDVGKYAHKAIELYYKHSFVFGATEEEILFYSYKNLKKVWDTTLSVADFSKAYTSLQNHANWLSEYELSEIPSVEDDVYTKKWHAIVDFRTSKKVIDWKTNKYASLSYQYRIQAQINKWAIDGKYGTNLEHFYFFFLYPNEWRTVAFNKKSQLKVAQEVLMLYEAMQKAYDNDEFLAKPRTEHGCNGCPYHYYCKTLNY